MKFDFRTEVQITLHSEEINSFFKIIEKITPDKNIVGFKPNKFTKKETEMLNDFLTIKEQVYEK